MLDDLPRSDDGQLLVVHPMFGDEPLKQVAAPSPLSRVLSSRHTAMKKVASRNGRDFGWETSSRRRFATPADSIVQGPFSVAPCQTRRYDSQLFSIAVSHSATLLDAWNGHTSYADGASCKREQVEGLFRGLFMDHTYSDNSCRKSRVSAMHGGKFRHGGPFGLRPQGIKVMGHGGGGFPSFIKVRCGLCVCV
jgi:hypothetical protein